jgi:hypothetical protein
MAIEQDVLMPAAGIELPMRLDSDPADCLHE